MTACLSILCQIEEEKTKEILMIAEVDSLNSYWINAQFDKNMCLLHLYCIVLGNAE